MDGTPISPTSDAPVTHAYTAPGTYPVRLILLDTNFCNQGDWKPFNLGVVANVEARVSTPAMGCAPYDAWFNNTSLGGHDYLWDFGDGSPLSTEMSPTHLYPQYWHLQYPADRGRFQYLQQKGYSRFYNNS